MKFKCKFCKNEIKPIGKNSEFIDKEVITGIIFKCERCDKEFLLDNNNTTTTLKVYEVYERKKRLVSNLINFLGGLEK